MLESDLLQLKNAVRIWSEDFVYIKKVFLYGSRARGDYSENSDLDVAVQIDESCFPNDSNCLATWEFEKEGIVRTLRGALEGVVCTDVHVECYCEGWTDRICRAVKNEGIVLFERQIDEFVVNREFE